MKYRDLPERWVAELATHLRSKNRSRLSAYDFPGDRVLCLRFPDGSFAEFKHAFALHSETLDEIAVFTEHCGYHLFPRYETEVLEKAGGL
ncbi:MAG TPA: hypothetical protein VGE29_20840 [Prosthecobacter sp.]